jgi:hypothetical protein
LFPSPLRGRDFERQSFEKRVRGCCFEIRKEICIIPMWVPLPTEVFRKDWAVQSDAFENCSLDDIARCARYQINDNNGGF